MNDPVMHSSSSQVAPSSSDRSLTLYVVLLLGAVLFIRFFVAAPYIVSGSSMEPNFQDWNYLIVDKASYVFENPARGDVIVLDLPQETSRALIKRIVGLPGDTIEIMGSAPTVTIINTEHPQGFTLQEPYISKENFGGATDMKFTLGPDQYFVLGDNRKVSADSRLWGILPRSDIVGRVFLRLYPLAELGVFPAEARYASTVQS